VDLDEEITTDDAGAVLERKSIPKKSALLNIPVAHAEGDFGQFENEWRQMTKVMKNSYCAVFYTTTNVNGNNDAVSETDVRSALSGCTNAAIKYKAWGWNSGPVRVTDNSAPQLKSNLYINGDTSKTRIPIFLYNTSGNEDSSVNGLFVPNNELSWVPLNGFTALMANNIGHGLTGSKRDYEFKATSAHEVSHYCQFFTNYSTHYLLTNEAFTEWTSSIVFPAPDFRTNYNNETYQYTAKGMHIPLKDYLKQDLSTGFMKYDFFSFFEQMSTAYGGITQFLSRAAYKTDDPLQTYYAMRISYYEGQGTTSTAAGQRASEDLLKFWRDYATNLIVNGFSNLNANESLIGGTPYAKSWEYLSSCSSCDPTINNLRKNFYPNLVNSHTQNVIVKNQAIVTLPIRKYDIKRSKTISFKAPDDTYVMLFEQSGDRKEPLRTLARKRGTGTTVEIGTVNPDYNGSYVVAMAMVNKNQSVASENVTFTLKDPKLIINTFIDDNLNNRQDTYEKSITRDRGVEDAEQITYQIKGPAFPTGKNFTTGSGTGQIIFGSLCPGTYTVKQFSYPTNWTCSGRLVNTITIPSSGNSTLNIPYVWRKKITARVYEDKAPFGDVRHLSTELALKDKFQFALKGTDSNNSIYIKALQTDASNGQVTFTAPSFGAFNLVYSKYLGTNIYYHTSTSVNTGVRKVNVYSTSTTINKDFGFRQRPVLALAAFTDKNGNMVKDSGEYYTTGVQLAFKIMRSDCKSTSQPTNFAYANYYPNKSTEVAYKVPLGRYYVSQVQVGQGPVQWVNMPSVYQINGSQVNGPIIDYCNALTAPVRKTYRFVNWLKPTVTAYFTQINSKTGLKSMLTSSACKLEMWHRDRHLGDLFPDTTGRAYYTLGDRMNLAFKPVCGASSHVFVTTPTQYYSYTEGSKKLYWDFTYYPNYINAAPALNKLVTSLKSYSSSTDTAVLGASTSFEPESIGAKLEKAAVFGRYLNPFYWLFKSY
jgi:hypothetical protein